MVSTPNFTDGTWRIVSTGHHGGTPNGDILWQNVLDQSLVLWRQDGGTTVSKSTLPGLDDYDVVAIGDFDGDGVEDVFLRNEATDDNRIILGGSNSRENTANSLWVPEAATDLDGDGKDDIVLVSPDGTMLAGRLMNGTAVVSQTNFASGYTANDQLLAVHSGVDADSFKAVWFDQSAGQFDLVTYTDGVRSVTDSFGTAPGNEFVRAGDFDGNGSTDILTRDNTGSDTGSVQIITTDADGQFDIGRLTYDVFTFGNIMFEDGGDFDDDGTYELLGRHTGSGETFVVEAIPGTTATETLYGGETDDIIDGYEGNDTVYGDDGDDIIVDSGTTSTNSDIVYGGNGDDRIDTGAQDDMAFGGEGDDTLQGQGGEDLLNGGAGDDSLKAGSGTDFLSGDSGDDTMTGSTFGYSHLRGGEGDDILNHSGDRTILEGNDGDDKLYGGSEEDVLFGGNDDDFLIGNFGADTLYGGAGDDVIIGSNLEGTDTFDDVMYGGFGQDFFYLGQDGTNYYTGPNQAIIKDFDIFGSDADFVVLNGLASFYNFVDVGDDVEIRQASDGNVIATVEGVANAADVEARAIYIS